MTEGAADTARHFTPAKARQALFTAMMAGLAFTADSRLGRPLGSFDRSRPNRAKAIALGRAQYNVTLSLTAFHGLAKVLAPDSMATMAAFDRGPALAKGLDDRILAGIADPAGRLRVEILQQAINANRNAALGAVGGALGLGAGFKSADGD